MPGDRRLFGSVVRITSPDGSALVDRADDRGRVRISPTEVAKAGGFQVGDLVEFRVWPGGMAGDALLVRRAKHLAASE